MKEHNLVLLIIISSLFFLLYGISDLSIRYDEAQIYFNGSGVIHWLINLSTFVFGQNDFALRLPFLILHILSIILMYKIAKLIVKHKIDRIISVAIYALLPGVNSAAILINPAGLVIFFTLFFIYLFINDSKKESYLVLIAMVFIDNSFIVLYLALFFYAINKKENTLLILSLLLFSIGMYAYGFDTGGKPKGYFLDTFGIYATIFSPLLFIYFIYAMYRILIKEEKNLLWYISFVTLALSLLLSFRQRLMLEDFAPYVVIAVPLMVKVFLNSYRVRLPIHRKHHTMVFSIVMISLALNFALTVVNKPLYHFLERPSKHFAYKYHIVKELAEELKKEGVLNIKSLDDKLALRLKFYGIYEGGIYELSLDNRGKKDLKQIEISYFGKTISKFYLYR